MIATGTRRWKFCWSILKYVTLFWKETNSPFSACKNHVIVINEWATALTWLFVDRFWFAWHFARVKSNQARGKRVESANSSTSLDQSKWTTGVKRPITNVIIMYSNSCGNFMDASMLTFHHLNRMLCSKCKFHPFFIVLALDGILSFCETPEQLSRLTNYLHT